MAVEAAISTVDPAQLILVTGFARGGTSWLRDCIAAHPDVASPLYELPVLDHDRETILKLISTAIHEEQIPTAPRYVNKAPSNSPHLGKAARLLPEAKFLFVVRDPRDVFVSHKRGNFDWMRGANSTVNGCMAKIQKYYQGYEAAKDCPNVRLVRYEDLHQDFVRTYSEILEFLELPADAPLLRQVFDSYNFISQTGRQAENRDSPQRKGVLGDWINHLEADEAQWYRDQPFWTDFFARHGYTWDKLTDECLLQALRAGGLRSLSLDDLLEARLPRDHAALLVFHDIDMLHATAVESILATARAEVANGLVGIYNFLPLDDVRYAKWDPQRTIELIRQLQQVHPQAVIGLHLNAAERFFPPKLENSSNNDPRIEEAVAYLHEQVDRYEQAGIRFRIATAHGYGRGKKLPNNRDTPRFTDELAQRGIALYDTTIRPRLIEQARRMISLTDVGGPIAAWELPPGPLDNSQTYAALGAGDVVALLTHPGNYDVRAGRTLGLRVPDWKTAG